MADKDNEKDLDTIQEETLDRDDTASAEAWDEELPPEDDFHDDAETQEVEIEETGHEDALAAARQEAQKRGRNVFFGIMGVGALAIGGLAYMQFAGSAPPPGSAGVIPVAAVLDVRELQKAAPPSKPVEQPKTLATSTAPELPKTERVDMVALYQGAKGGETQTAVPALPGDKLSDKKPEDAQASPIVTTRDVLPLAPMPVAQPQKIEESPVPSTVSAAGPTVVKVETIPTPQSKPMVSAPAPDLAPAKTEALLSPNEVAPKVDAAAIGPDPRLKDMEQMIATLKKSLDEAQAQNAQLTSRVESLQKPSTETEALKAKVAELEKKLAAKDKASAAPKVTVTPILPSPATDTESASVDAPKPVEPQVSAEPSKKPVVKKAAASPKKKTVSKTAPAPKTAEKKTGWVLRAATPDAAWVSQGKTAVELRRVAVGETVPGLGKIKEIRQVGDGWHLITEKGTVR